MTAKEQLLEIKTYEEYLEKRHTLKGLKPDKEVLEHLSKIFPKVSNTKEELHLIPKKLEDFLNIKTYEEFDNRRTEFKGLTMKDERVRKHMYEIFPEVQDIEGDIYSIHR